MDKYSVIIPTLWKSENIYPTTNELCVQENVGEIILIDNAPHSKQRDISKIRDYEKINIVKKESNIYVNPAWNLGVRRSSYTNICICNDDILFNVRKTFEFLKDISLIRHNLIVARDPIYSSKGRIQIEKAQDKEKVSFELFFIHKDEYTYIPECLKIWFGDDWLYHNVEHKKVIKNINLEGETATSASSYSKVTEQDRWIWETNIRPQLVASKSRLPKQLVKFYYMLEGAGRHIRWKVGIGDVIRRQLGLRN